MNSKPLLESRDADFRGIDAALRRAAQRAREIARATDTRLVLSHDGRIEYVVPDDRNAAGQGFVQFPHE